MGIFSAIIIYFKTPEGYNYYIYIILEDFMLCDFIYDIKNIYAEIKKGEKPDIESLRKKWSIKGSIGEAYELLQKKEEKKISGTYYTPCEIAEYMCGEITDKIDLKKTPHFRILDPSCGGGAFLLCLFDRLCNKAKIAGIKNPGAHVLKYNLFGIDMDETALLITKVELYIRSGILTDNLYHEDYLFCNTRKFDIIIGNPPYMGHKVLTGEYRRKLYMEFREVFSDKGDLSYCFIKKSVDLLKKKGELLFFSSRYLLEAVNGKNLREFIKMKCSIRSIIDFYGIRVVKGAGIDNIIIHLIKDGKEKETDFFRLKVSAREKGIEVFDDIKNKNNNYTNYIKIKKSSLNKNGWVFLNEIEKSAFDKITGIELSAVCRSYQGIITGCDDAFILDKNNYEELNIECSLLKPWIKSSSISKFSVAPARELIIYSNIINDINKYPAAIEHILKFKAKLENRRECLKGMKKWYYLQWERNMDIFDGKKIVFPFKSSSNRFAVDTGSYFSADVYALKIRDMFLNSISYEYIASILNSSIYEFYIKAISKKLGEDLYEYYPNKIMTVKLPLNIKEIEEISNDDEEAQKNIDMILISYFGISLDEYDAIRSWCV